MVCMGYGVVRPSLGRDVHKIMAMALVYFLSSAVSVDPPPRVTAVGLNSSPPRYKLEERLSALLTVSF